MNPGHGTNFSVACQPGLVFVVVLLVVWFVVMTL